MSANNVEIMFKTVDYQVARSVREVNDLLARGYELHGPTSFFNSGNEVCQALVKCEQLSAKEYIDLFEPIVEATIALTQDL
jgi:hypothetical protein